MPYESDYPEPAGTVPGLRKRLFWPGDICGYYAEAPGIEIIPERDWPAELAREDRVRMTRHVWDVYDQASNPSCASESSYGLFKIAREWQGQDQIELNPLGTFKHVRVRGGGSSLDANLWHGREYGFFPEALCPRSDGITEPSDKAHAAARQLRILEFAEIRNRVEAGSSLLRGHPFSFGRSGHSWTALEMIDPNNAWSLNSYGIDWGEKPYPTCLFKGFAPIRLDSIQYNQYGAYTILTTTDTTGGLKNE